MVRDWVYRTDVCGVVAGFEGAGWEWGQGRMTGKGARNKGAGGERELFKLLSDELGIAVQRNLSQTRGGGADSMDVKGWAIECKRVETLAIPAWWAQTLDQAERTGCKPALFYRQSRKDWVVALRLSDIAPAVYSGDDYTLMTLPLACQFIRSTLQTELPI